MSVFPRRMTKAAVPSASWSSSASATTLTVETGDLAKDSVIANNIQAGAITAREMTFGVNENSVPVDEDSELTNINAVLFDLSQPDCVGSNGTRPEAGKEIVYASPTAVNEMGREFRGFHSPRMIGQSEAIFQTATNLVKSPEDLTTADWLTTAVRTLTDQYVDGKRLTKVQNGAAAVQSVYQNFTVAFSQLQVAGSVICRKGNTTNNEARFDIYNDTQAAYIFNLLIHFDNYPNSPGTPGTGTLHDYTWIDGNTVELRWCGSLVNVNDNILCAGIPFANKCVILYVKTRVFPDPAPAITRDAPLKLVTASL